MFPCYHQSLCESNLWPVQVYVGYIRKMIKTPFLGTARQCLPWLYISFHFISKIQIIWLCESGSQQTADLLASLYIEWITGCIKHWMWKCSHCSQKDEWITNSNKTNNKKQRDETRFSSRWAVMKPSWLFCGQKNWIYVNLTVIKDNTFIKTQSETVFLLWGLLYFPYIMGNLSQSSIH